MMWARERVKRGRSDGALMRRGASEQKKQDNEWTAREENTRCMYMIFGHDGGGYIKGYGGIFRGIRKGRRRGRAENEQIDYVG